jgi:hypothetical protein
MALKKMTFDMCKAVYMAPTKDVGEKFSAILNFRSFTERDTVSEVLVAGYPMLGNSEFLRHEIMFWMGQLRAKHSIPFLLQKMHDPNELTLCRHESASALSNYEGISDMLIPELKKHYDEPEPIFRNTVRIAIKKQRDMNTNSRFGLNGGMLEPAEPFDEQEVRAYFRELGLPDPKSHDELLEAVRSEILKGWSEGSEVEEYTKYRLMYFVRDVNTEKSFRILCDILTKDLDKTTPLFRHDLAAGLGAFNTGDGFIDEALKEAAGNEDEHPIVRHESLIAIKDVNKDPVTLERWLRHPNQIIRDSAVVAKLGCCNIQYSV